MLHFIPLAGLVGFHQGQDLTIGTGALQERRADIVGEGNLLDDVVHRGAEKQVEPGEETDGEEGIGGPGAAHQLRHQLAVPGAADR